MDINFTNRLKLIAIFCQVIDSGSMRQAANKLGISSPAVSQFISQLETELGTVLLYRSTRKLSLSEAGQKYYQQGCKMLAAAEQAEDIINQMKHSIIGELRIALPVGLAASPVAHALRQLMANNPELKLSIVASDGYIDPIAEGLDIIIDVGQPRDSSCIYHYLASASKTICASQGYLAQHDSILAPEALARHTWLAIGGKGRKGVLSQLKLQHSQHGSYDFTPTPRLRFNNLNSMIAHVKEGYGLAILPQLEVNNMIATDELVRVLPAWQCDRYAIYALTMNNSHSYKVTAALDALKSYFAQHCGVEPTAAHNPSVTGELSLTG